MPKKCKMSKSDRKEAARQEEPKYRCGKCGEKAEEKKHVCKPKKLD